MKSLKFEQVLAQQLCLKGLLGLEWTERRTIDGSKTRMGLCLDRAHSGGWSGFHILKEWMDVNNNEQQPKKNDQCLTTPEIMYAKGKSNRDRKSSVSICMCLRFPCSDDTRFKARGGVAWDL